MNAMIEFTVSLLNAVSDFVASEPIIYLFSVVILCFIVKLFKTFLP